MQAETSSHAAYFELLKKCLLDGIYTTNEYKPVLSGGKLFQVARSYLASRGMVPCREIATQGDTRLEGKDWPTRALSMIGVKRMDNLQQCVETVLRDGVPGDLIETGVWRGGSTILMKAILNAYGEHTRNVWVADSFEGLPKPNEDAYPDDRGDDLYTFEELSVSQEQVQEHFRRFDLLDANVRFLKGWFKDTLPSAPIERLAVMRLDGDMYESTMDALKALYPKLSPGGFVIIDDYGCIPACKKAVEDYRSAHGIVEPVITIDWSGVYWRRA
jgi:O-methyltransferase